MSYKIVKADGTSVIVKDSASAIVGGLTLLGYGFTNFGDELAQNFVNILENSASNSEPTNPVIGQWWLQLPTDLSTGTKVLKLCVSTTGSTVDLRWSTIFSVDQSGSVYLDAWTLRGQAPVNPDGGSTTRGQPIVLGSNGLINSSYLPVQTEQTVVDTANRLTNSHIFGSRNNGIAFNGTQDVPLTTAHIAEGDQLYFTTSRARTSISGSSLINFDQGSGVISLADLGSQNINFASIGVANQIYLGTTVGSSANTDPMYISRNNPITNVSEMAMYVGDDGSGTLLTPYGSTTDFFTVRATNDGIHHMFGTDGNYTAGGSIRAYGNLFTYGIVSGQTPDNTTTGGLRVRANSSGDGIIQLTTADESGQLGWMRLNSGEIDWNGKRLLNTDDYNTLANLSSGALTDSGHYFGGYGANTTVGNYMRFSNGMVMQWGQIGAVATGSNSVAGNIYFPVVFPNACVSVVGNGGPAASDWSPLPIMFDTVTTSGTRYIADSTNSSHRIYNGNPIRWIALGY